MGILLGGPSCFAKRRKGNLMIFFEWYDDARDEIGRGEPTMFIARANKVALSGNRGCAAIPLPAAYLYADSTTGDPTVRLLKFSQDAAHEIGLDPGSRADVYKIADAIVENLPDLIKMPPEPRRGDVSGKGRPIGEISLVADGKTVAEAQID